MNKATKATAKTASVKPENSQFKTVTIIINERDYADMVDHILGGGGGRPLVAVQALLNEQGHVMVSANGEALVPISREAWEKVVK